MLRAYRKEGFSEFLVIAIGYLLLMLWMTMLVLLNLLRPDPTYTATVEILTAISLVFVSVFLSIFYISIKQLSGERVGLLGLHVLFYLAFVTGFDVFSLRLDGVDRYAISYNPPWALSLFSTGILLTLLLIIDHLISRKGSVVLTLGLVSLATGMVAATLERRDSGTTFGYFIFISVGLLLIALSLARDPSTIIMDESEGMYIVLSERETGGFIYERSFDQNIDVSLFSAGMRAILDVMDELLEDVPQSMSLLDGTLLLTHSENFVLYVFCKKETPQLLRACSDLLRAVEAYGWAGGLIDEHFTEYLSSKTEESFSFAFDTLKLS